MNDETAKDILCIVVVAGWAVGSCIIWWINARMRDDILGGD